jgi:ferric-dicitrate binding protein FerR (iron transport regulator)
MPLEPETDLHWTAFLYISGDLPPAESTSFEARLADDQEARDAVAEAVELAGALAIVGAESRPRRRSKLLRAFIAASALAAAACLVLTLQPGPRPTGYDRPDASEVALAWSSLRGGADIGQLAEIEIESESEVEPSTDRALPSWLLSAASAPLDDPKEEE